MLAYLFARCQHSLTQGSPCGPGVGICSQDSPILKRYYKPSDGCFHSANPSMPFSWTGPEQPGRSVTGRSQMPVSTACRERKQYLNRDGIS